MTIHIDGEFLRILAWVVLVPVVAMWLFLVVVTIVGTPLLILEALWNGLCEGVENVREGVENVRERIRRIRAERAIKAERIEAAIKAERERVEAKVGAEAEAKHAMMAWWRRKLGLPPSW